MTERVWLAGAGVALQVALLAVPLALARRLAAMTQVEPALLIALSAAFVAAEILAQRPAAHPVAEDGAHAPDRALAAVTGAALYAMFASGVIEAALRGPLAAPPIVVAAGACTFAFGVWLRSSAIRALAGFFVTEAVVVPGQPLVTTGLYRVVRHPSEAGLLAIGVGTIALSQSAVAIVVWLLVLLPASMSRIGREDAVLARAFGSAHARYAARVGALVPRRALQR